jgi:hypothetical protein
LSLSFSSERISNIGEILDCDTTAIVSRHSMIVK